VIAGAVTLFLAAGTAVAVAVVAGPVDSSSVIHACYGAANADGTTHNFVLQDAGTTCPSNMTSIQWNQSGPAGPVGPAGAVGPAGPQGPPGPTVTATPAPTASPDNEQLTALTLGTLGCGQSKLAPGVNVGGSHAWYVVTWAGCETRGVIGLFIWARIDDQRQRSFVRGYPGSAARLSGLRRHPRPHACRTPSASGRRRPDVASVAAIRERD